MTPTARGAKRRDVDTAAAAIPNARVALVHAATTTSMRSTRTSSRT